jgi:hypothetical protein
METDVTKMNLWQRLHHAGENLKGRIAKDKENTFDHYDYASHDKVVEFVRPALQAARLVLTIEPGEFSWEMMDGKDGKKQICVTGVMQAVLHNIDKPEESYAIPVPVLALDRGDKAHGKAISYGKKYAITACIGLLLATGEDTDSDSHTVDNAPPRAKQAPPATKQPPAAPPTDKMKEAALTALKETAKKFGLDTAGKIKEYAKSINLPIVDSLSDMTAVDMNILAGKMIVNLTKGQDNA